MAASSTVPAGPRRATANRSSAARARHKRQRARERIHDRVVHAIDTPHLLRDPLERRSSALRSTLSFARLLLVAGLLHGLLLAFVFLANRLIGSSHVEVRQERLKVHIVESRAAPPPAPVEEVAPPPAATPAPTPPPEPRRAPRPKRPLQAVPPDLATPVTQSAEPARRVVGLSMESAVQGGSGPAFAIGTSRMGETAPAAHDPTDASRTPSAEVAPNRISTRFAEPGASIIPPRRLAANQPAYPALLREQGVEADVVVSVSIASDGRVAKVEIVKAAKEQAFNDAALAAAKAERYAPATRAGEAVPFTQSYTIRFRLND